jgi:hypothetical protein
MNNNKIAVVLCIAMLTVSGLYLWVITTYIPGWSNITIGNQLLMALPSGLLVANVVAIMKTI